MLTKAGFDESQFPRLNEVILVTEPEAAAAYTARYLNEFHRGQDFLRVSLSTIGNELQLTYIITRLENASCFVMLEEVQW